MKKQTAVEWLIKQLTEVERNLINKTYLQNNNTLAGYKLRELFNQALEMEKEQMIDAFMEGADFGEMFNNEGRGFITDAEQYYNNNYKSE